jgi:hypothetical protein
MTTLPIDAVVTWVDGQDQALQKKLTDYLARSGLAIPDSMLRMRLNQCGEINWCIKSLLCFAPWLRTIYIVTDNQTPPIVQTLKDSPDQHKIKMIDHRDIFSSFENALPTFNSLTIESALWRIEGLADHFIYLNDDCTLLRPTQPEDFFRNNKPVLRGTWKTFLHKKWQNRCKTWLGFTIPDNPFRILQENTARMAGFEKTCFHLPHAPLPLLKQTFEHFFQKHPEHFTRNIQYPLRDAKQFWPISLAQHLDIKNNQVVFDNTLQAMMINGAVHSTNKIKARLAKAKKNHTALFCMQNLDFAPQATQNLVFDWLDSVIQAF